MQTRPSLAVVAAVVFAMFITRPVRAAGEFEPPVRLEADGKVIDTGAEWGHSSPAVFDVDGDKLDDLIVGDFSGKFRIYKNVGKADAPKYTAGELLKAGGVPAEVNIYCCIGAQPRFHDLDGDGVRDMLSNSYDPGHAYLFRGMPGNQFAAREELLDVAGVPIRSSPVQQQKHQSFGSFFEAVDWDADGDLDLLIGCFGGDLRLRINEGSARSPRFAAQNVEVKLASGEPLKVKAHHCPVVADWDADGLWDIVSGSDDGSVTLFRNVGDKAAPKFADGQTLVKPHDGNGYNIVRWNGDAVVPGIRAQPEVVDFNRDGKLDLLVGDFYTEYDFKPNLTEAQKKQVKDLIATAQSGGNAFKAKMDAMQEDFRTRYPGDEIYSDKANKEWSQAYRALRESPEAKQMEADEKKFADKLRPFVVSTRGTGEDNSDFAKSHGHVWLFIRK